MTITQTVRATLALGAVMLFGSSAHAVSPADKCEADKLKVSGKYGFCRLNAESKAAKANAMPNFSNCDAKFSAKWASVETHAAGQCPSNGDAAAIQAFIEQHTDSLVAALSGGSLPSCALDLATCNSGLATCTGSLATSNSDLGTCNSDLSTAQSNLTTCTSSLGTCSGDLATCTGDLGTCSSDLSSAQGALTACSGDLAMCSTDLGTCSSDLTMSQTDLATCSSGLATCSGDLATCNSDLGTAQTDLSTCTGSLGTCTADLATCAADLSACQAEPVGQRLKTGQTTCFDAAGSVISCAGTGQNGESQTGLAPSYVDNGDGTITDVNTGLVWEKLSDDGSIHDRDTGYTWANAFTKPTALNSASFAGYTDWRVPTINELQSLVSYGTFNPSVHPAFNTGCVPGCASTACSCIATVNYWSSTTYEGGTTLAWRVRFFGGGVDSDPKTTLDRVRAVRGGS